MRIVFGWKKLNEVKRASKMKGFCKKTSSYSYFECNVLWWSLAKKPSKIKIAVNKENWKRK
jgi:hypothetical protein